MSEVRPTARPVKRALRRANLSGSFIVGKYSFSPYMACEHGCVYCDGRAERYWVDGEFDRDIIFRPNLPDLLAGELPGLRERGFISIGSGISDAYQPLERELGITARCAEILAQGDFPVSLMTKSALVLRDLDLWSALNEKAGFMFLVSLTHGDDASRQEWEPRTSSVSERLDALRRFKSAGCVTGILAMPVLPGITDTPDNLRRLFDAAAETGVDFIMPAGLTLRPGKQKEFFLNHLRHQHDDLTGHYQDLYREERASGAPVSSYLHGLRRRTQVLNREYRIPFLVPHRVFREHLHLYDEINVLLHHMTELYDARDADTRPLKSALNRYLGWLEERKREYNRHRSWSYEDLAAEVRALADSNQLAQILNNPKLAEFLGSVITDRSVLDYTTLELHRSPAPR